MDVGGVSTGSKSELSGDFGLGAGKSFRYDGATSRSEQAAQGPFLPEDQAIRSCEPSGILPPESHEGENASKRRNRLKLEDLTPDSMIIGGTHDLDFVGVAILESARDGTGLL